jgi:hypothetical protein
MSTGSCGPYEAITGTVTAVSHNALAGALTKTAFPLKTSGKETPDHYGSQITRLGAVAAIALKE